MLGRVNVNNTTSSFLIDVIIRNQDIKKLETTCFGLTLTIIRFHLEKLFCKSVIQLCKCANGITLPNISLLHNGDGKP